MTPEQQRHLTDEALDDVLIGLGSPAAHAHLAQCADCRRRVESFQSGIDLFNQASLAYSEAQPVKTSRTAQPARRFLAQPVFAVWAAAAALLVLAGPAAWHLLSPHSVHAPAIATEVQDTEAQIAEDNELLEQVNAAIAPNDQNVVDQFQLTEAPDSQAAPGTRTK